MSFKAPQVDARRFAEWSNAKVMEGLQEPLIGPGFVPAANQQGVGDDDDKIQSSTILHLFVSIRSE